MAIKDTLTNICNYIRDIALTRSDINLSNLSHQGKAEIALQSNGVPWTVMSNVITSSTDVTMTENDDGTLTFSGSVTGLIPNGKSVQHPGMCDSIEADITISNTPVSIDTDFKKPQVVVVNEAGTVSVHNYVVSYTTPSGAVAGDMWYDLGTNYLRFYETEWTQFSGVKLGTLKHDTQNQLVFTMAGAVQIPDFDTIITEVELAKAPTGTVIAYMGTDEPEGYLLMDGRELSRTTYSRLFSVIGTTQGEGDGSTTFNIADMTDGRYLMGSTVAGGSIEAGLPNITGYMRPVVFYSAPGMKGPFYHNGYEGGDSMNGGASQRINVGFSASRSNAIYGASSTVTPLSRKTTFVIKY